MQAVDVPCGLTLGVFGGDELTVDDAVLALDLEAALNSSFDFERLLLELRQLLQKILIF